MYHGLSVQKETIAAILVATLVFVFSLYVIPYNTHGDQEAYDQVYDIIPYLKLDEAFWVYQLSLSSREPIHFSIVYFLGEHVTKDVLMSFLNFILAFITYKLLKKLGAHWVIALMLVVTNYYLWVLYGPAERLKVAFIFIFAAWLLLDNRTRFAIFAGLGMLSHVSTVILLISGALVYFRDELVRFSTTFTLSRALLFILPLIMVALALSIGQMVTKASIYFRGEDLVTLEEAFRMLMLFGLSLFYAKERINVIIVFFLLTSMVFMFGGDRVNMFGYLAFIYFSIHYRGGFNLGVLATSFYFMNSTLGLINNILYTGDAYFNLAG